MSFEDVVSRIAQGGLLDVLEHPNPGRYSNQRIFVVRVGDYAYLVPFVEDAETVFLKSSVLHKYVSGRLTEKERAKGPGRPRAPR